MYKEGLYNWLGVRVVSGYVMEMIPQAQGPVFKTWASERGLLAISKNSGRNIVVGGVILEQSVDSLVPAIVVVDRSVLKGVCNTSNVLVLADTLALSVWAQYTS
jgi:hypothetical protein